MKRNWCQQIYNWITKASLIIVLLLLVSNPPALRGQAATDKISTINQDATTELPLLPPLAWFEKRGITLDEFLKQLRQRVEIKVENAGFAQAVGAVVPARLQDTAPKTAAITAYNAGAAQSLNLALPGNHQVKRSQAVEIAVQQAGAQGDLSFGDVPNFAIRLLADGGIKVKQAGYTREFDLLRMRWQ